MTKWRCAKEAAENGEMFRAKDRGNFHEMYRHKRLQDRSIYMLNVGVSFNLFKHVCNGESDRWW